MLKVAKNLKTILLRHSDFRNFNDAKLNLLTKLLETSNYKSIFK